MRSKVVINLSTDDPLEAEILDMLADIKSSHRKQERLRSLLKGGYNLFYKNMSADRAMTEAFDKQDVALILSLFGRGPGGVAGSPQDQQAVKGPSPVRDDPIPMEKRPSEAPPAVLTPGKESVSVVEKPQRQGDQTKISEPARYKEIVPKIEDEKVEMLDFDPGLMELENHEPEPDEYVDPLKRLFNK